MARNWETIKADYLKAAQGPCRIERRGNPDQFGENVIAWHCAGPRQPFRRSRFIPRHLLGLSPEPRTRPVVSASGAEKPHVERNAH